MSLLITKAGILSTIQDLGRTGFRRYGVNTNGVMDRAATRLINTLIGNAESEAVLEMHYPAGEMVFETEAAFVIGGADFSPRLNDRAVENWAVHPAAHGERLSFGKKRLGHRSYLAVAGGFDVEPWLGSLSTNLAGHVGGFGGRRLETGDRVPFRRDSTTEAASRKGLRIGGSVIPSYSAAPVIRISAGPEFENLTAFGGELLLGTSFQISKDSNRMGYRLEGPPLFMLSDAEMVSSAVTFGTVQRLPDGQLIVLMADHQTTGGYPRIATVASVDLPLLAQVGPGDAVSFRMISLSEAQRLAMEEEKSLGCLRAGLRMKLSVHL